ncbi:helix-turn-helix transcriptional regulator [Alistipes finegoldii]|uniref:helix-turn-helix transcriptional regulator n=1 Tax=Alistipes finegoldii TaxID=214856 RepID=UPI00189FDA0A|nr:helix-turn-helix transcriptional regulator [Alistipes finegoldii]
MLRRLFILAAVVSLGLPAVRAQEGAASHAAVIQADTLPVLLERLERDPEDIDLLVEICSQYTMRSEFAAIHPYVSRLRRAGAAHDDERALMYADLFSGQSYLLAEGSDSTRIYLDRALIRGRQCEDPVALCRIYNALGIYAVSIETNYFGGIEYFLEAMEYARSASLNRFYLVAQCNLANTYYMRNDPAGLKYAEEVCRLGTEWGYDYLAFGGAVISAYMHYMLGDQDRALEYILRTLPDTDKFGYHTELYSLYANILHAQGDDAGAERYYLMALDHIDEKVVTAAVMTYLSYGTYLNDRGEYARAIPVLRQGIELSERSNNAVHRYKLYQRISEAETALGRYREALDYFKSYHSQADSIFNVERERSINELRVKYDAERQENMLRKSEIDLIRQQRRFQLLLLLLLFAVGISTVVYILYRRKDKMYKQIVRQQYEFLKKEKKAAQPAMPPPDPISPQTEKQSPDRDEHAVRDAELFARIEYLMQTEGVYRQNDLTIERLAERLDTNRTYISRAINQQAGKTFSSYVNSYRIDEAVRRLSDVDDDTPLKSLAQTLGYNHLQTFYTSFQSAIGMPPSKYREKLLKLHREHQL